jgi:hypothetical protein
MGGGIAGAGRASPFNSPVSSVVAKFIYKRTIRNRGASVESSAQIPIVSNAGKSTKIRIGF